MPEQHDPMELAIAWLRKRNLSFDQKTLYQLKIEWHVSYYPGKGTIFIDGDMVARGQRGLRGLEQVLVELGYLEG
jgi:hypothetical protein